MRAYWSVLLFLTSMLISGLASATVTCNIGGNFKVEPMDGFYCDTNHDPNCAGWAVIDLDAARGASAKAMRYMRVEFWQNGVFLKKVHTNSTGAYFTTLTLPGSTCVGQVITTQLWMERLHEDDLLSPTLRYRFAITVFDQLPPADGTFMTSRWTLNKPTTLTATTTIVNYLFPWTPSTNPSLETRLVNLYFVLDQAIGDIATWTANLDANFQSTSGAANGIFRVVYGPNLQGNGGNYGSTWFVQVGYGTYNQSEIVRHELGHAVREAFHDRTCTIGNCTSYNYSFSGNYGTESCEYGAAAFNEGLASFIGVRSATATNDTNAWSCRCANNANQDVCSEVAAGSLTSDGVRACPAGSPIGSQFYAIGDRWITNSGHCKRVQSAQGCGCPADGAGYCLSTSVYGWRNWIQVQRYLWDIVDTSTDSGLDTTDESITTFAWAMEGTPTGYGVDGSCRESERASAVNCNPGVDGQPVTSGTGSRDAYNTHDISDLIAGSQSSLESINCVAHATDN
jgi:hypothetical protein